MYKSLCNFLLIIIFAFACMLSGTAQTQTKRDVAYAYTRQSQYNGDVFTSLVGPKYYDAAKGTNLLIIQLESIQNFLIDLSVDGVEVTPNLNKIVKKSLYYPKVFTQIGKGNTSDAEFMTNTSLYPTGKIAMSKGYSNRLLPSLPKLLENQGYTTLTMHTNYIKFWSRHRMYPALGFDRYYDSLYFGTDDKMVFSASDEVLYRKTIPILKPLAEQKRPFYAFVVSMSSHQPFYVPEMKKHIELPARFDNNEIKRYLESANYADYALGQFFDQLKANGIWDKTTIVIYGDHFGVHENSIEGAKEISNLIGKPYHPYISKFNVPFIIHIPGVKGEVIDRVGGQVDLMPTIANLYGLSLNHHTIFGQDLNNSATSLIGMRYYLPTGSFVNDRVFYVAGATFGEGAAYNLDTHEKVFNTAPYKNDYYNVMSVEQASDAYVESLPINHKY